MIQKNILCLACIYCIINSCTNKKDLDSKTYYNVPELSKSRKNIINSIIKIDTIILGSNIESSFKGTFSILNDTIFFSDEYFGYVFRFTKKGTLIDRNIGKGKGPNETLGFNHSNFSNQKYGFLNGYNSNLTFFDKKILKEKEYRIDWQIKRSQKEVLANPIPEIGDSYEFDFGIPNIFKIWDNEHVSIAITASHPKFNGYFDSSLYYNYSRILAIINIYSGKVVKLIGRRSLVYLDKKNIPNFDHFNYEVYENEYFVNFWADEKIYVIDKQSEQAIGKFGLAGKDMNVNYPTTQSYEKAEEKWESDLEIFGYYHYFKYLPFKKLFFRGYTKGEGKKNDGLQIYKGYDLIGDISIPKGLQVIGEIEGAIYAMNTLDSEENDGLKMYKIKLDNE